MTNLFWRRVYEDKASDRNPIVQSGRGHKYDVAKLHEEIQRAIELLRIEKTHTVLDVGCANGLFADLIGPRCQRVIGIEPVGALAKLARSNFEHIPNASVLCATGEAIPLRSGSINRVLLAGVIQLNPPEIARRVLNEAARVLRPGGRMVLLSVPDGNARSKFESAYLKQLASAGHLTEHEKREIASRHANAYWYTAAELTEMLEGLDGSARAVDIPDGALNAGHRFDFVVDFED